MIITPRTKLDPRLSIAHLSLIMKLFEGRDAAFIETVDLDEHNAPHVPCDLYGPVMDDPPILDEHTRLVGERRTITIGQRLSLGLPVIRRSNLLTLVVGEGGALREIYGGQIRPMDPADYTTRRFWQQHALGVGLEIGGI